MVNDMQILRAKLNAYGISTTEEPMVVIKEGPKPKEEEEVCWCKYYESCSMCFGNK